MTMLWLAVLFVSTFMFGKAGRLYISKRGAYYPPSYHRMNMGIPLLVSFTILVKLLV